MAKQQRTDAVWVNIDPSTLLEHQQRLYAEYKEAYRMMKAARKEFETSMNSASPDGKHMIFGYNFGKLSVALVDDDRKPAKPKAAQMTLADYISTMSAQGRAT